MDLRNRPVDSHVVDGQDSAAEYEVSSTDSGILKPEEKETMINTSLTKTRTPLERTMTRGSTWTSHPDFEVDFEENDKTNPRQYPLWYKSLLLFVVSFNTLVVVLYSTSYTTAIPQMTEAFHTDSVIGTLGVTTYLLGLATGSLFLAPVSETFGRRPTYLGAMLVWLVLVIPSAKATSMASIITVRFFCACGGSVMIANAPGSISDIISDEYRALAFSIWSIGPLNGPVIGPVIGGFVTEYLGWRWTNWLVLILGGAAICLLACIKETYTPAILRAKAKKMRKQENDDRYWSRYDSKLPFLPMMKVALSRPFHMAFTEPICMFWNVYIAIVYGILYLCFVAYPIVFSDIRGWSTGFSGLAFLGIGIGSMITICCERLIRYMIEQHKDPDGSNSPEGMMSIVCIAAIAIPIGELWFAWTCAPSSIHWAIPIAAGIPFGAGNTAVFIYASNYVVHCYGIYAASAMAGNSVIRSILGGTLPLAGPSLYAKLGPNWAGTLLGLLEVLIIPIPFIFYRYGGRIRRKSRLITEMREDQARQEAKREKAEKRLKEAEARGKGPEVLAEAKNELARVRSVMSAKGYDDLA